MSYVLVNDQGTFFKQMTGIGPMATNKISEAEIFEERMDAALSPAMRHTLAGYRVVELKGEAVVSPKGEQE